MLPLEVRWNTLADCLQSYLDNWATILTVCEEHRDSIDVIVARKVQDLSIKRNPEDYLKRVKPIAIALDKVQSDSCKLSEAVEVQSGTHRYLANLIPYFQYKTIKGLVGCKKLGAAYATSAASYASECNTCN